MFKRIMALLTVLALMCPGALAEEAIAAQAVEEAVELEADAFYLGDPDPTPEPTPEPTAEPTPEPVFEEEPTPESAPAEAEAPVREDAIGKLAVTQSLTAKASTKTSVYVGDVVAVTFSKGAITGVTNSNPSAAYVAESNNDAGQIIVVAAAPGKATLKATHAKGNSSLTLTVLDPNAPTAVKLPSTATVSVGETLTLTPTLTPSTATGNFTWSSAKPKVAAVDASTGLITPLSEGKAKITVQTSNGKKATCNVTVVDPYKPSKVSIESAGLTVEVGGTLALTPALTPSTARTTFTWSTGSKAVATVSEDGVVTAIKEGKAKITVKTANNKKATVTVSVVDPYKPSSVAIQAEKTTLTLGESMALIPALSPSTARTTYTWSSGTKAVATVSADGVVTGLKEGKTKITVKTANNKKATLTIEVTDPYKPTSVSLGDGPIYLGLGGSVTLTPVLTPDNASTVYTWSSSKKTIASVSNGVVTGLKAGSSVITVKTSNKKQATITVVVQAAARPTGVALPSSITLKPGESRTLEPTLTPADATATYTWSTGDSSVATVSGGVVTGVKAGTANVTVRTDNGLTASCAVTVSEDSAPTGVSLPAAITMQVGTSQRLTPTLTPSSAKTSYTWSTSNSGTVSVINGVVTANRGGTAVITVKTSNGLEAQCAVTVEDGNNPTAVALPASITLAPGETQTLTPTLTPEAAQTSYTWTSGNTSTATVADGVVTGKANGTTTVTVRTANGLEASCTVVVRTTSTGPQYRALLVGQDNFYNFNVSGWDTRDYNSKAAARMQSTLNGITGPDGGKYSVTLKSNLDKSGLTSAIQSTFADADDDDVSLFYYASHGRVRDGALVCASVTEKSPEYLALSELSSLLAAVPGKVIVMLDTCGSGAAVYAKGDTSTPSVDDMFDEIERFDAMVVKAFSKVDTGVVEYAPVEVNEDGVIAKTGELIVVNKFYVLCSCQYQEESWAYTNGSFFTDWVCDGIGKSGSMPADTNYAGDKDGQVDLLELYSYVSGVGDNRAISGNYQHVQVYPADTRYAMFK